MASTRSVDQELLKEAVRMSGCRSEKATINEALEEYVARRRRLEILDLFGRIDYDPDYAPKEQRARPLSA